MKGVLEVVTFKVKKFTKQTNRGKALKVAMEYEYAVRLARSSALTEDQCRRVISDILGKTTGEGIRYKSVEEFLKDWVWSKQLTKAAGVRHRL